MTFLPIVTRELRVAARRASTYWVRTGAAVLVLAIGTWCFLMMQSEPPRMVAMTLFGILTGSAVLYCLLSGVRSTADCISQEKREGTLGLLFLTDLKGYDVVVGKLAATSVNVIYGVLAVVPMLAIPLLIGGVTVAEFARMALVAVNTMFFSLALGIFISSLNRSARKAMGVTFFILLLLTAFLPFCAAWLALMNQTRRFEAALLLPSVGFTYSMAFDSTYRTKVPAFWVSLAVTHALGWVCLVLASLIAPRSWQDKPASVETLRWRERWRLWSFGNLAERVGFRRRLLDRNAFFWLAARARLKPALVWGVLGLMGCVWFWGAMRFRSDWFNEGIYLTTAVLLNLMLKGWVAAEAGRQLAEDRHQGTLELLLSTPISVQDILHGQFLALKRQFLGPTLAVLVLLLLCLFGTLPSAGPAEERFACVCFFVALMVMLVADLAGLYWVGMWQAMVATHPNRAASGTIARILVLPWVAYALIMLVVSLSWSRTSPEPSWKFFLGVWVALGAAADLGFALWSRHKLLREFRRAAEQRYRPRAGFWKRLLAGSPPHGSNPPA